MGTHAERQPSQVGFFMLLTIIQFENGSKSRYGGEHQWTHDRQIVIGFGTVNIARHKMEEVRELPNCIEALWKSHAGKMYFAGMKNQNFS